MKDELDAMESNQTWSVISLPKEKTQLVVNGFIK